MDDLTNRYGISYNQMLHDLTILKMQHMDNLSVKHDSSNNEYDEKLISCYYKTISDLNDALNNYKETHYF